MCLLLLLCGMVVPETGIMCDTVDLIEVNHFYDDEARLVFLQVIFYDWAYYENRYQVRAWRLLKHDSQIPRYNWTSGDYETIFQDGDVIRRVRAKYYRETWTQYDPEIEERERLPKDCRRGLRKLRKAK